MTRESDFNNALRKTAIRAIPIHLLLFILTLTLFVNLINIYSKWNWLVYIFFALGFISGTLLGSKRSPNIFTTKGEAKKLLSNAAFLKYYEERYRKFPHIFQWLVNTCVFIGLIFIPGYSWNENLLKTVYPGIFIMGLFISTFLCIMIFIFYLALSK